MENCKGCYTEDMCAYTGYSETCPCIMCLIKVVCKKSCKERLDFRVRIEAEVKGEIKYAGDY